MSEEKQCAITINDRPNEYAIATEPSVFKQSKYKCEKHGDIGNNTINFNLPKREPKKYCLYCYQDMVAKYCWEAQEQE